MFVEFRQLSLCLAIITLFLTALTTSAQNVTGKVSDTENGQYLLGANVLILSPEDSSQLQGGATTFSGDFSFEVESFPVLLKVVYLGYRDTVITLNEPRRGIAVPLLFETEVLEDVQVESTRMTAVMKGDTTEFTADDFKTNQYANTEDLLTKMPGVVKDGGGIKAQGEEVQRVTVDGKPFFGDDPNAALKNLPAQMVDKVQVHDRKSEQAELTGVDDGETTKAINLTTKEEFKRAAFGKGFLSYGTDERYHGFAGLHFFNYDQRISLLMLANNINIQNFSQQDLATATGDGDQERWRRRRRLRQGGFNNSGDISDFLVDAQTGITEAQAIGVNLSDYWGERDSLEVNGSYFFNHSENLQESQITRDYFLADTNSQRYTEENKILTENLLQRGNFRLNWLINEKTSILFLPNFSTQSSNRDFTNSTLTLENQDTLSTTSNSIESTGEGMNLNNDIIFRRGGKKKGSSFVASLGTSYQNQSRESIQQSTLRFFNDDLSEENFRQEQDNASDDLRMETEIEWTKSITEVFQFQLDVEGEYEESNLEQEVFQTEASGEQRTFRSDLSNDLFYRSLRNSVGLEFLVTTKNFYYRLSPEVQRIDFLVDQQLEPNQKREEIYLNFTPSTNMNWKVSEDARIRAYAGTRTALPNPSELQTGINNNNPQLISTGNPELDQEYIMAFITRTIFNRVKTGTNFNIFTQVRAVRDRISIARTIASQDTVLPNGYNLQRGVQFSQPVNLDGYYQLGIEGSAGRPVKFLNINLGLEAGFTNTPSLINGQENTAQQWSTGGSLSITSNISEKIDFNLRGEARYNDVSYELTPNLNNNFVVFQTNNTINWEFYKGFFTRQGLNYTQFFGQDQGLQQRFFLWNMSFGKRFLKEQNLEASIEIFDLLNQNAGISRTLTETYTEAVETTLLQQYFMVKLTYNIQPISLINKE